MRNEMRAFHVDGKAERLHVFEWGHMESCRYEPVSKEMNALLHIQTHPSLGRVAKKTFYGMLEVGKLVF